MIQWWAYCRGGFEAEMAAELGARARELGVDGRSWADPRGGLAAFEPRDGDGARRFEAALSWRDLVFARQLVEGFAHLTGLPPGDRVGPVVAALPPGEPFSAAVVEAPDTEAGKALGPLCGALAAPLEEELRRRGRLGRVGPRLHVLLLGPTEAVLATADPKRSSPWPGGIPRLKLSRDAPSRSALKLEEALGVFLPGQARESWLAAGMYAVDLGAAPGGWSWVLARAGLRVTAVDNGALSPALGELGLVEHVAADGFTWRPPWPVDWMVCDMVAAPTRVAKLVGLWTGKGLCRASIFNLKLPTGKRREVVETCAAILRREAARAGGELTLRFKQLYHDREEVTGYLRVVQPEGARAPGPRAPARSRAGSGKARGEGGGEGRRTAAGGRGRRR